MQSGTDLFHCGNGLSIPLTQLCDGHDDCAHNGTGYGRDETHLICDSKSDSITRLRTVIAVSAKVQSILTYIPVCSH